MNDYEFRKTVLQEVRLQAQAAIGAVLEMADKLERIALALEAKSRRGGK